MIKFDHTDVYGWEHAIRGMRNPMESHDKSDSWFLDDQDGLYNIIGDLNDSVPDHIQDVYLGENDHDLMMRLSNAGRDHRKFMRMLVVYVDITAPLYWWKEFDTYKVGTVANSCSTMHCIHKHEFTLEDFSYEHLLNYGGRMSSDYEFTSDDASYSHARLLKTIVDSLNGARERYLDYASRGPEYIARAKDAWWQMIQLLPSSYNQKRTIMLNYEVLANIYHSRKDHKLDEWRKFCAWIEELPHSEIIIGYYTDDEPKEEEWF